MTSVTSYVNATENEFHETGQQPVLIATDEIKGEATERDLYLEAPFLQAPRIKLLAARDVTINDAVLEHFIETHGVMVGFDCFGKDAIISLIKGKCHQALLHLRDEFPILKSLNKLEGAEDLADQIGEGIHTLKNLAKTLKAWSESKNIQDFVKGQINLNPEITVTEFESSHKWTTIARAYMIAQNIIIKAGRNVALKGINAKADKMDVDGESISVDGSEQTSESHSSQTSVGVGLSMPMSGNFAPSGVTANYSTQQQSSRAKKYIPSVLNVGDLRIHARKDLSMRNAIFTVVNAYLKAQNWYMETPQDTFESSSSGYGGSVSVGF